MRGWVKAEEVTPGKWWQLRDGTLRRREPSGESISFVREGDLFWKRGRPLPDDPRWLPTSAAIAEWGERGGSKGWWALGGTLVARLYNPITMDNDLKFIPRGKPPLPKDVQEEQFESNLVLGAGWLKCKLCLISMPKENAKTHVCNRSHVVVQPQEPQEWTPEQVKAFNELKPGPIKPFDTGVRMATYAVIPLETHRKRLEEFASFAKSAFCPAMYSLKEAHFENFVNALNAELARLLEEAKA